MKLLWDSIGTEFGARHELYEVNYSGSHEEIRRFAILGANASGQAAQWKAFADQSMAEYDIHGWTVPDLVNPIGLRWAIGSVARIAIGRCVSG